MSTTPTNCPFCQADLTADAERCPACGNDVIDLPLLAAQPVDRPGGGGRRIAAFVLGVLVALGVVFFFLFRTQDDDGWTREAPGTPHAPARVVELPRSPPVAPVEAQVTLDIRSEPNAEVIVDGAVVGVTPLTLRRPLGSGPLSLQLRAAGYEEHRVRIVPDQNREVRVLLQRLTRPAADAAPAPESQGQGPGTLSINTRPWTTVSVDGRRIGNSPILRHQLPAGRHRVTVVNEDLNVRESFDVRIENGRDTRVIKSLTQ